MGIVEITLYIGLLGVFLAICGLIFKSKRTIFLIIGGILIAIPIILALLIMSSDM
jgi:hypothetical protein